MAVTRYELADNIALIVVDGYDQQCFCILYYDVRLHHTDGQSEVLIGRGKRSIGDRSS